MIQDSCCRPDLTLGVCCMNRLKHLQQTLPKYIDCVSQAKRSCEIVLINYNSQDKMDEWVYSNYLEYIRSGILTYFHTTEPQRWNAGHAHNLAIRLSKGAWFCNVDADNFFDSTFIDFLDPIENHFYRALDGVDESQKRRAYGVAGRICCSRSLLFSLRGYDETLCPIEDADLATRLKHSGCKLIKILKSSHRHVLSHTNKDRTALLPDPLNKMSLHKVRTLQQHKRKELMKSKAIRNPQGWGIGAGTLNYNQTIQVGRTND